LPLSLRENAPKLNLSLNTQLKNLESNRLSRLFYGLLFFKP
jgi:hypothetical protein